MAQPVCTLIVYIMFGLYSNSSLSSISNLRKPAFTATCAVSVFYANWAANEVRRMNNGAFNAMTDEEEQ
ncbi:hypothetical protein T05_2672 [Trichinella murrelli]|uniref:Uncharacterized protein n=1 Tax=Trichinella murrelli TaxID=144512 RepID=A0A0V0SYS3_9BILA|nr:hypothetical protein T05_2672 [Trichinella murrelli]